MFDHYGRDAAALCAAVWHQPLDDTPRLVLADHLEDCERSVECSACAKKPDEVNHPPGMMFVGWGHGWQPCSACEGSATQSNGAAALAEFIRVQCELARLGECPGTPTCREFNVEQIFKAKRAGREPKLPHKCEVCRARNPLTRRETELWKGYAASWYSLRQDGLELEPVIGRAGLLTGYGCEVQVTRGFPGRITTTQDTLIRLAPQLGRLVGVTGVRLSDRRVGSRVTRATEYYWQVRNDNLDFHENGINVKIARCMAHHETAAGYHGILGNPTLQIGIGNRHKIVEQRFGLPREANECLSRACVNYIRKAAGLEYLYPVGEQKPEPEEAV